MVDIALDILIIHSATDQALRVKDGVGRIGMEGVLGAVSDPEKVQIYLSFQWQLTTYRRSSSEKLTQEGVIR